jgi:phosphatidylethanolamine/phosphatidyl-N-methylethanolamine N-methyltransferase
MQLNPIKKEERRSRFFFLKQYLRKPFGVGALAPSGPRLATLMVRHIDLEPGDVVVELGPGTGVFTRELLARGVPPQNLILVETNPHFASYLRAEFPGVHVANADALDLAKILKPLGHSQVRKIVSGIPFRSIKAADRKLIAKAIATALAPGGKLAQFSYFNSAPLPKATAAEVGLTGKRVGLALNNVPPAFVWQYTKKP